MSAAPKENNAYTHLTDLFAEMTALVDGDPERERLRTQIIESSLPITDNIAARYRGRGQSHEDLVQVARLGLVNAVDRFDLGKGRDFLSFAVPTMMGEVRRYFRDKGWGVRVPRSLQENYLPLNKAHTSPHSKLRTRTHHLRTRSRDRRRTLRGRTDRRRRRLLPSSLPRSENSRRRTVHRGTLSATLTPHLTASTTMKLSVPRYSLSPNENGLSCCTDSSADLLKRRSRRKSASPKCTSPDY